MLKHLRAAELRIVFSLEDSITQFSVGKKAENCCCNKHYHWDQNQFIVNYMYRHLITVSQVYSLNCGFSLSDCCLQYFKATLLLYSFDVLSDTPTHLMFSSGSKIVDVEIEHSSMF